MLFQARHWIWKIIIYFDLIVIAIKQCSLKMNLYFFMHKRGLWTLKSHKNYNSKILEISKSLNLEVSRSLNLKNRSTVAHWYVICFSPGGPGFKSRQGTIFRIKMKDVTFELLRCSYSHIWWIYRQSPVKSPDIKTLLVVKSCLTQCTFTSNFNVLH